MARTIRTCSHAALVVGLVAASLPAHGRVALVRSSGASIFVGARAAELQGDARRAAVLYASLAQADPANAMLANRAISQAISAGDMTLALRLAKNRPPEKLGLDARLALAGDLLLQRRTGQALDLLRRDSDSGSIAFIAPLIAAWEEAKGRDARALDRLSQVPAGSIVAPYLPEHRLLILLRLKRPAEAVALIDRALTGSGGREARLRTAMADGFDRAGDRATALRLVEGSDSALVRARTRIAAGNRAGAGIETAAQAFAELLTGIALDLNHSDSRALPVAMLQVARHSDPSNPTTPVLLGLMLGEAGRVDDGLAVLRSVPSDSLFRDAARDAEIRVLGGAKRFEEAAARATAFAQSPDASARDWGRLGDVYDDMDRHELAASAFARAIALVEAGAPGPNRWQLYLLRGAMLERAGRWPEARASLDIARQLAPTNPLVLNFLGYAQLERGENLDVAEALVAEASRLSPDDASITDSLGWAQYKRGKIDQAIATLQRAAAAEPGEAEIHEHLGDALYTAGRKFEARHSWNAALITSPEKAKQRVEAKIRVGLNPATAAP